MFRQGASVLGKLVTSGSGAARVVPEPAEVAYLLVQRRRNNAQLLSELRADRHAQALKADVDEEAKLGRMSRRCWQAKLT